MKKQSGKSDSQTTRSGRRLFAEPAFVALTNHHDVADTLYKIQFVHLEQLIREDGSCCKPNEVGSIMLAGSCTMKGYYFQLELTQRLCFKDSDGKVWLKMGAYGSLDKFGSLRIRGRKSDVIPPRDGKKFPLYKIEEAVTQDTANVMSCTVVRVEYEYGFYVVVHVEQQPTAVILREEFIYKVALSIRPVLPGELYGALFIRYRDNIESFPIAPSGKRDAACLIDEGIVNAQKNCNII